MHSHSCQVLANTPDKKSCKICSSTNEWGYSVRKSTSCTCHHTLAKAARVHCRPQTHSELLDKYARKLGPGIWPPTRPGNQQGWGATVSSPRVAITGIQNHATKELCPPSYRLSYDASASHLLMLCDLSRSPLPARDPLLSSALYLAKNGCLKASLSVTRSLGQYFNMHQMRSNKSLWSVFSGSVM